MGILLFIVVGFIAGLLARAIMPGRQHMGLLKTTLLGIAGSVLGGFVIKLFTSTPVERFEPAGLIGSLLGALVLLGIYIAINRRTGHPAV